jgi:hypothetical protein
MNGIIDTASPAAEKYLTSCFLEMELGTAFGTRDVCFCQTSLSAGWVNAYDVDEFVRSRKTGFLRHYGEIRNPV